MTSTRLREHLEQDVLGWWSRAGADDERGGVHTGFTSRGERLGTARYTWSQGRWAWTCALVADEIDAGRVSGDASLWRDRSIRTARFLTAHAFLPDGRTSFLLDTAGRAVPDAHGELATSVFADLFAVLGLAGAARTSGTAAELATARRTLRVSAASIADRSAATAPYPVPAGFADLAGPMLLAHTAAELHAAELDTAEPDTAAPDAETRALATAARTTLLEGDTAFLGPDTWWEFRPDRAADHDTLLARHVTPGHLLELLWMLVHLGDRLPRSAVAGGTLETLALRALETGWDHADGGLLRYVDRERGGEPTGRLLDTPYEDLVRRTWDTKLWWVHAEAVYATALLAHRTGSAALHTWARRVREYTFATFPDPEGREWIQVRSRDGSPLEEVVALPVKDPLHVARSLLLLNRLESTTTNPATNPATKNPATTKTERPA